MTFDLKALDRVISYIDVLGFSAMVSTMKDSTIGESYQSLLDVFEDVVLKESRRSAVSPIEFTYFSDSVVFSCPRSEPRAEHIIFEKSRRLAESFLLHEFVCRGGIAYGPTYHAGPVIFGRGMLVAYYLESKVASYPRIVIDETLALEAKRKESLFGLEPSLCISDSGLYFLDIFGPILSRGASGRQKLELIWRAIGEGLWKARLTERPDVIAKWMWLKNHFNKSTQGVLSPELTISDAGIRPQGTI